MTALRLKRNRRPARPAFVGIGTDLPAGSAGSAAGHVALVPGAEVALLRLDLPAGLRGLQRERVMIRHLRDAMGLTPERVEIRPLRDPADPAAWTRVLVADRDRVAAWRAAAGEGCRAVLPDYLALPAAPELWVLAHEEGRIRARLGPFDGFTLETDLACLALARRLALAPPRAVLWQDGARVPEIDALLDPAELPLIETPEEAAEHGLAVPALLAHGELECDLRQDPQGARDRLRRRVLPWRWPVGLAALALALWCAALVIETRALRDRATALRAETLALAREHFVPDGPILDVRVQVETALERRRDRVRALQDRASPLDLTARAGQVVVRSPARVDELVYGEGPDGEGLTVHLRLPDYAAQDALAAALREAGLVVDVVESGLGEGGGDVRAEIRLSRGGGG